MPVNRKATLWCTLVILVATGCTTRHVSPTSAPLTPTRLPAVETTFPSAAPSQSTRPGATCAELFQLLTRSTKLTWRPDDNSTDDRLVAKPGMRQCLAQTSSTANTPPAIMSLTLFRPRPDTDTPDSLRRLAVRRADKCTTAWTTAPAGLSYAVSCVEKGRSTITNAQTVISSDAGWVQVFVHAQHSASASTKAKAFVAEISQRAAAEAFPLI